MSSRIAGPHPLGGSDASPMAVTATSRHCPASLVGRAKLSPPCPTESCPGGPGLPPGDVGKDTSSSRSPCSPSYTLLAWAELGGSRPSLGAPRSAAIFGGPPCGGHLGPSPLRVTHVQPLCSAQRPAQGAALGLSCWHLHLYPLLSPAFHDCCQQFCTFLVTSAAAGTSPSPGPGNLSVVSLAWCPGWWYWEVLRTWKGWGPGGRPSKGPVGPHSLPTESSWLQMCACAASDR